MWTEATALAGARWRKSSRSNGGGGAQCVEMAHVEAGMRSFDRAMPEELNRLMVDSIADMFFTTTAEASCTLRGEGHAADRIHLAGNLMIDSLYRSQDLDAGREHATRLDLTPGEFMIATFHRPSNVDQRTARAAVLLAPFAALPLGLCVAATLWLTDLLGVDSLASGLLAVGVLALGTRAFHLDGLADTADGLTASYDRERSLSSYREPSGYSAGTAGYSSGAAGYSSGAGLGSSCSSSAPSRPPSVAAVSRKNAVSSSASTSQVAEQPSQSTVLGIEVLVIIDGGPIEQAPLIPEVFREHAARIAAIQQAKYLSERPQ